MTRVIHGAARSGHPRAFASRARAAFTLVEVLVVLVILGIVAAVATPAFTSLAPADDLDRAVDELRTVLERGRATALEQGMPVRFVLDPGTGRWWIRTTMADDGAHAADSGRLSPADAVVLQMSTDRAVVRFLPSGAVHGTAITLREGARLVTLRPDPWTGAVESSSGARASLTDGRETDAR